ncbi:MAG: 50S ribosomal protein L28 [Bdellovibrio sp.]|nr:50S ribosomal protein L28 [Bdellovibrio sp.]
MSRKCDYCGKKPSYGNQVSHSNIETRTRWLPNIKRMKAVIDGLTRTVRVCTRCIRSGKITRPTRRKLAPQITTN